ncbi:hypothetical protein FRX31_006620, partial [Thalictrum thalictroides]
MDKIFHTTISQCYKCLLFIDLKENVVAEDYIYSSCSQDTVHGIPLGPDNAKVSIGKVIDDNALLPIPTSEHNIVLSALSSFVPWPKKFITQIEKVSSSPTPKIDEGNEKHNPQDLEVIEERDENISPPRQKITISLGFESEEEECYDEISQFFFSCVKTSEEEDSRPAASSPKPSGSLYVV